MEAVEEWKGQGNPVHYVTHHGVQNSHSKSTPLRVVVNSTTKNCFNGPDLNSLFAKGPNSINSLYRVLIRWREFEVACVYDVSKAYHSMKTGDMEFFLRLMVWKFHEDDGWQIYGHNVVGMGDLGASVLLELTKGVAAEVGRIICELASKQLKKNGYVQRFYKK